MRYAIYFTPAQSSPLAQAAAEWLGRDAFTGDFVPQPEVSGVDTADHQDITGSPRRYGFHATLKAPFRLAAGESETALLTALENFAANTAPFSVPGIRVGNLSGFFALIPDRPHQPLNAFAAGAVTTFERFRAPITPAEIARRNPENLSPQEAENLRDWGYPYVFDSFRFHMTLTNRVPLETRDNLQSVLESYFAPVIDDPFPIDGVALFVEPEPGAAFIVRQRIALSGTSQRKTA